MAHVIPVRRNTAPARQENAPRIRPAVANTLGTLDCGGRVPGAARATIASTGDLVKIVPPIRTAIPGELLFWFFSAPSPLSSLLFLVHQSAC